MSLNLQNSIYYQNIASKSQEVFFIRSEQMNQYEEILKKEIGDRMH